MYYTKFLISPDNRRLKYFHLIVALTLFFDFFLTGLIIGNYKFFIGLDNEFCNHRNNYTYICIVQSIDIILNFLKQPFVTKKDSKPREICEAYLRGNFCTDLIAMCPYSVLYPNLIILRYLKLLKYNTYLGYFEEFIVELCNTFMNNEQIKLFISMFRLMF